MALAIDTNVSIKFSTLTGVVKGAAVDNVTLQLQYLVEYTDQFGEPQMRYFYADQIEAI